MTTQKTPRPGSPKGRSGPRSGQRPASRQESRAPRAEAAPARDTSSIPENALQSRAAAAALVEEVLRSGQALDDCLARMVAGLDERDMALVRAIALVTFRRLGAIRHALQARMAQGAAAGGGRMEALLATAAAQILFMDVPNHAAVDCAVTLVGESERDAHKRGFVNAILRRIGREKDAILSEAEAHPLRELPDWLAKRWERQYGEAHAAAMAAAQRHEPTLDITVASDPEGWAEKLGARLLRESNRTVTTIALDVGYDSEAAFSRAFRRMVGMPPAARCQSSRRRWRSTPQARSATVRRSPLPM